MKRTAMTSAVLACLGAVAMPEIENLSVSQNRDRMVSISFSLTEKAIVTMDILTNGVSIGADNYRTLREPLSPKDEFPAGRVLAAGPHTWMWRPTKEWPGQHLENNAFSVKVQAWSFDAPPDYMVVDGVAQSNITFYASAAELPYGGIKTADPDDADAIAELTNDVYRTSKLILRKIPAAGVKWRMGSPEDETYRNADEVPHYVTLTNDYYVSIYLFSLSHLWRFFRVGEVSYVGKTGTRNNQTYTGARGAIASYNWPADGHEVSPTSGFGYMRGKTGLRFDFLTEAEWEYACRAGTEGRLNVEDAELSEIAWSGMSGSVRSKVSGLKLPNKWGLYDMLGLCNEWCLDQYGDYPESAILAPEGVTTNLSRRIIRGGPRNLKWNGSYNSAVSVRSAYRGRIDPTSDYDGANGLGIRVSCPASLPDWMRQ